MALSSSSPGGSSSPGAGTLALLRARPEGVVAGVAVQDGNLAQIDPETGKPITVPELIRFAREELRLNYLFWGTEEPYLTQGVLASLCAGGSSED